MTHKKDPVSKECCREVIIMIYFNDPQERPVSKECYRGVIIKIYFNDPFTKSTLILTVFYLK